MLNHSYITNYLKMYDLAVCGDFSSSYSSDVFNEDVLGKPDVCIFNIVFLQT